MKESNEQGITSGNGYAILKYAHITLSCKVGRHLLSYTPCPRTDAYKLRGQAVADCPVPQFPQGALIGSVKQRSHIGSVSKSQVRIQAKVTA